MTEPLWLGLIAFRTVVALGIAVAQSRREGALFFALQTLSDGSLTRTDVRSRRFADSWPNGSPLSPKRARPRVARCVKTRARPRRANAPRHVLKDVSHVMSFRTRPAGAEPGL